MTRINYLNSIEMLPSSGKHTQSHPHCQTNTPFTHLTPIDTSISKTIKKNYPNRKTHNRQNLCESRYIALLKT